MDLSWGLILGAGLIDGINPCAFAVLVFMMGYLTRVVKNKRQVIVNGLVYILTVYLSYLLIGLGLLQATNSLLLSDTIYLIAGFTALITGVLNVKDYFYYGEGITLRIPKSQKERISEWVKKGSVPSSIILGLMVSLFELPCTGSVYFAILALLSKSGVQALSYLIVYNLMFILPLIVMFLAILLGYKVSKAKAWKEEHKDVMKLISGLLLLGLGVWMLWTVYG